MGLELKKNAEPLSDIPSVLLRQALDDLLTVKKMRNFTIKMSDWFVSEDFGDSGSLCAVCHAGAVMASRFSVSAKFDDEVNPCDFDNEDRAKFNFINLIRIGDIRSAFEHLYNTNIIQKVPDFVVSDVAMCDYGECWMVPDAVMNYHRPREEDYHNYILGMIGIFEAEGI